MNWMMNDNEGRVINKQANKYKQVNTNERMNGRTNNKQTTNKQNKRRNEDALCSNECTYYLFTCHVL